MKAKNKGLNGVDVLLGMICLIFFVDTIAPMSAMGVTAITWALIIAVVFYIPSGMIESELATTYRGDGGMYAWVKEAYGKRWGARVSWIYWANTAVWIASVSTFFIGVFVSLLTPNLSFFGSLILMLAAVWSFVFISLPSVEDFKFVTNAAAGIKLFFVVGMVAAALYYLFSHGGAANDFHVSQLLPHLNDSLTYLPALLYNFLGFEAMMTLTVHMKNPKRDIPKATIFNSILVASIYITTSLCMLIVIPTGNIDIVTGVIDFFRTVLGGGGAGPVLVTIIGILFLFTLTAQTSSWLLAACRMAAAAADDGELPKIFARRHKKSGAPMGGLFLMGIIGTVLIIIYGFFMATTVEELFWTFFSFVSILYLIPFIINYQGYTKLRKRDKDITRPFTFPGPKRLGPLMAHLCQGVLAFNILLFFHVPGTPVDFGKIIPLAIGIALALIIGEILISRSLKKSAKEKPPEGTGNC